MDLSVKGSQTVTGTLTQDGFGNTVSSTGSSSNPYLFAAKSGYRNDGDAGLTHVGARYYDAQVGRFITRDTYLDQKSYLYCEHDPINATDPDGQIPVKIKAKPIFIPISDNGLAIIYDPSNPDHPIQIGVLPLI